jgi:hypothetical protein
MICLYQTTLVQQAGIHDEEVLLPLPPLHPYILLLRLPPPYDMTKVAVVEKSQYGIPSHFCGFSHPFIRAVGLVDSSAVSSLILAHVL